MRTARTKLFSELVSAYVDLLLACMRQVEENPAKDFRTEREEARILKRLSQANAKPSDLVDLHTAALRSLIAQQPNLNKIEHESARMLLLTLMGRLADTYRRRG